MLTPLELAISFFQEALYFFSARALLRLPPPAGAGPFGRRDPRAYARGYTLPPPAGAGPPLPTASSPLPHSSRCSSGLPAVARRRRVGTDPATLQRHDARTGSLALALAIATGLAEHVSGHRGPTVVLLVKAGFGLMAAALAATGVRRVWRHRRGAGG